MIIESSRDALDERIRLIESAEREIVIVTYENHDGESTRDILAAALHKADEGVKVRFLVDGIAGRFDHMGGDLFQAVAATTTWRCGSTTSSTLDPLEAHGPHARQVRDRGRLAYILGGRNMFDTSWANTPPPTEASTGRR